MKRFIAVQTGARRNYAIPSILENAGMLEAFYTDMCANAGLGKILDRYCPVTLKKGIIQRLSNRQVPSNIQHKVKTSDWAAIRYLQRQQIGKKNWLNYHQNLSLFNHEFSDSLISKGVEKATHIFSMFGEGTEFLNFAKNEGLKIVTEIYISPLTYEIIQKEKNIYPELEEKIPEEVINYSYNWWKNIAKITDVFIAPSDFVIDGLKEFDIKEDRCYKIPYAVDDSWLEIQNQPQTCRVLFVGTAELRKGIHILGIAAQKLNHLNYEFRVAGGVLDSIKKHKLTNKLNFIGRVSRANIKQEFAQADIFVLPSLAEGSAEVTYEALASGLPVITTKAAGSVVRDGIEGFIIPSNDPDILAKKIEELIENRDLRNRMAIAAKERAKEYTWDKYSARLLTVFETI
jgi:glycosyltransferase involved in cell wall biosynthesis